MKGLAFRKLSRTTAHRNHLLRNLVTSLLKNERITTTVAKAKEAQKQAEKIITKVKRAQALPGLMAKKEKWTHAVGYVFDRGNMIPLLRKLADRYVERPGGYTRIHLFGNRLGDHAPRAILELVDNSKGDLMLEMTARSMARETLLRAKRMRKGAALSAINRSIFVEQSRLGEFLFEEDENFNEITRTNVAKLLKFAPDVAARRAEINALAEEHLLRMVAEEQVDGPGSSRTDLTRLGEADFEEHRPRGFHMTPPTIGRKYKSGMSLSDLPERTDEIPKPVSSSSDGKTIEGYRLTHGQEDIFQPPLLLSKKKNKHNKENSPIRVSKAIYAPITPARFTKEGSRVVEHLERKSKLGIEKGASRAREFEKGNREKQAQAQAQAQA